MIFALHTYIVPTQETKLWEETTTARTKGMPNNEGMRGQPPPREVGGAKLWSHFHWTPLNWPRGEQKTNNSNQGPQCIMPPARSPDSTEFKGVTYFPRDGLIMYAAGIENNVYSLFVLIGHFLVPKILTFKMRSSAQPFLWKRVLFAREWKIISISKAEHLTSFWYRGPGKLGNGLLPV